MTRSNCPDCRPRSGSPWGPDRRALPAPGPRLPARPGHERRDGIGAVPAGLAGRGVVGGDRPQPVPRRGGKQGTEELPVDLLDARAFAFAVAVVPGLVRSFQT